jgi:hypothetical protein
MKIICLSNLGSFPPVEQLTPGDDGSIVYPIEIGETYKVYGLLIAPNTCHVLIAPQFKPRWVPIGLFEIVLAEMDQNWVKVEIETIPFYNKLHQERGFTTLVSYPRLTEDPAHYNGVVNWEPEALLAFYQEVGLS